MVPLCVPLNAKKSKSYEKKDCSRQLEDEHHST